jgi:hypothetical protein
LSNDMMLDFLGSGGRDAETDAGVEMAAGGGPTLYGSAEPDDGRCCIDDSGREMGGDCVGCASLSKVLIAVACCGGAKG